MGKNLSRLQLNRFADTASEMTYIVSSGALNSTPTPTSTRWTQQGRHAATIRPEQELDLENEVSPTVAQPPGTLFLPTSTTLLTPVPSENDSSVLYDRAYH